MGHIVMLNGCYTTIEDVNHHLKTGIIKVTGLEPDSESVLFFTKDGFIVEMYHMQDCCEHVFLESADSIDNEDDIYTDCDWCEIEEVKSDEKQSTEKALDERWDYSFTWTFYKVRTNKGNDVIRWYGSSNGYYSESVDFRILIDEVEYVNKLAKQKQLLNDIKEESEK